MRHFLIAALLLGVTAARAETTQLRLGVQPGLTYLPWIVAQHEGFIEKAAAAAGVPGLTVTWQRFSGGQPMNDALISDSIDVASTGIPSYLALWAKGKGRLAMIGLMSYGYIPIALVTRNPDVKTLADFTDKDRIALPGAKTSIQAIFISMAAEKLYGTADAGHFDSIEVGRAHPDAMAALLGSSEINSHFSIPPYLQAELKRPGMHLVTTPQEIVGSPVSNGVTYLSERFYAANPKVVRAVYEGVVQANALINRDPKAAARIYLEVSGEKTPPDEIETMITLPGTVYDVAPHGVLAVAKFLHRTGFLPAAPNGWKELFLPFVHSEDGS